MKIHFFTIVLDGMPWIAHHLPVFHQLPPTIDWDWTVIEGVALPLKDTAWCQPIEPSLSIDGTHEYLCGLHEHPRVFHRWATSWSGKVDMCNEALRTMNDPGLIWQVDADELWTERMIGSIWFAFKENPNRMYAEFFCRYFVGPHIVIDRAPGTWTNEGPFLWKRVWRFVPGMQFETHEPARMKNETGPSFTQQETEQMGCVFDHYAYSTENQAAFKERYYDYKGAVEGWRRLQSNIKWPAMLRNYFPWVKDGTTARPRY